MHLHHKTFCLRERVRLSYMTSIVFEHSLSLSLSCIIASIFRIEFLTRHYLALFQCAKRNAWIISFIHLASFERERERTMTLCEMNYDHFYMQVTRWCAKKGLQSLYYIAEFTRFFFHSFLSACILFFFLITSLFFGSVLRDFQRQCLII